jgi:hypothetical protein
MAFCWTLQVIYGGCPARISNPNPKWPSQKPEAKMAPKKTEAEKSYRRYYSFLFMCHVCC